MQSRLDIINLALANLGNLNFVQSNGEKSPEAEQGAAHYDTCRDLLLAEHPWSFASRRVTLSPLTAAELPPFLTCLSAEESLFPYPVDCVFLRRAQSPEAPRQALPFRVERSGDSLRKVIRTRAAASLDVLYTTNDIPVPDYPAAFVQAFAWRLAANIALSKRADPQLAQAMLGAAGLALGQARLRDAAET